MLKTLNLKIQWFLFINQLPSLIILKITWTFNQLLFCIENLIIISSQILSSRTNWTLIASLKLFFVYFPIILLLDTILMNPALTLAPPSSHISQRNSFHRFDSFIISKEGIYRYLLVRPQSSFDTFVEFVPHYLSWRSCR